jgi:hypothetical protein
MKVFTTSIKLIMASALMTGLFMSQASAQTEATRKPSPPTQQMNQQQKLTDMNHMLDRMDKLANQLHNIHQAVEQRLTGDQSPENTAYLNHIKDLETSMGSMGEQLKATVQKYNSFNEDKARVKGALSSGDMSVLHDQLNNIIQAMEKAVGTLQSMNDRVTALRTK